MGCIYSSFSPEPLKIYTANVFSMYEISHMLRNKRGSVIKVSFPHAPSPPSCPPPDTLPSSHPVQPARDSRERRQAGRRWAASCRGQRPGTADFLSSVRRVQLQIAHSEGAIIAEGNRIGLRHYPAQKGLALLLSWTSPRLQQNNVNLWRTQGGLERARGAVVTQVIHLS